MTTTHEQIRITKHDDHYQASLWVGQRFITAEGDTKVSAHLSLFDRLVTDDDPAIVISPDIADEIAGTARLRADKRMVVSVWEAWNSIRHQPWRDTIDDEGTAIEVAAQIVYGKVEVEPLWIEQWPSLRLILMMVLDAYRPKSVTDYDNADNIEIYDRLNRLLVCKVK